MAKAVPAVERAIAILRFLGRQPSEPKTLSEIARETGTNLSTCHSIVIELAEAGFLLRHDRRKTYSLGPALLEFASLASQQYLGLGLIRDEIGALSGRFDVAVTVGVREADEIIVVAHHDATWGVAHTRTGFRSPMVPPIGLLFLAWASETEQIEWLERLAPDTPRAEIDHHRQALEQTRERRYWMAYDGTMNELLLRLSQRLALAQDAKERQRVFAELAKAMEPDDYPLTTLSGERTGFDMVGSAVFDHTGSTLYTVTAIGQPGQFHGPIAKRISTAVVDLCDRITKAVGGKKPARARRPAVSTA